MKQHTKEHERKLKWVEEEFVVPAFNEFVKHLEPPMTLTEYDYFINKLFDRESRVQVVSFGSSVDFITQSTMYVLVIGYLDEEHKVLATRPIMFTYGM